MVDVVNHFVRDLLMPKRNKLGVSPLIKKTGQVKVFQNLDDATFNIRLAYLIKKDRKSIVARGLLARDGNGVGSGRVP